MILLRPMTELEFTEYMKTSIPHYAAEKMRGEGLTQEEADKVAEDSFKRLLPDGLKSKGSYLFSVVEESSKAVVGTLWFARQEPHSRRRAYVYDIVLHENARGKGYGKRTMELLEDKARGLGFGSIGLHVFGHNKVARGLYEKLGYQTTNIWMSKEI